MSLRAPDTLTAENSEKYKMSIRLWPGGLSFLGAIPSEKDTFFYDSTTLDKTKPYIQALKDVFFEHAFFTYPYKETSIICTGTQYTMVPETVFEEAHKEQLMNFIFSAPEGKTRYQSLKELEAVLLFSINLDVYDFFSRSLVNTKFIHAMSSLLLAWRKQNLVSYPKQLYVSLHEDTMDAACFDRGALLFVNSFPIEDRTDVIYYLLYIWKQLKLNQVKDQLCLSAEPAVFSDLKDTLQNYLLQIEPLDKYRVDALTKVPADVMALFESECES